MKNMEIRNWNPNCQGQIADDQIIRPEQDALEQTRKISPDMLRCFRQYLIEDEKSPATIEKYMRDVSRFAESLGDGKLTRKSVLDFKASLTDNYAASSANSMIAAINAFFRYNGWVDLCVKQFRIQKQTYCPAERDLTKDEYFRLIRAAEDAGDDRLCLILETIGSTGIRISELEAITVEAVRCGEAIVSCKGKTRRVFIVKKLRKKLIAYIKRKRLASGPVFVTRSGKPVSRSNVWRQMKKLCSRAHVKESKVFPHNLRHLFAKVFYSLEKDIAKLADILGHTSINTTRIYIITSGEEHRRRMERMQLLL